MSDCYTSARQIYLKKKINKKTEKIVHYKYCNKAFENICKKNSSLYFNFRT